MRTIVQRLASAWAVFCGPHGAVTQLARDHQQSRPSLYRQARQVADAVAGTAVQARLEELQRQLAAQQAEIEALHERLQHAVVITAEQQHEFAIVAQAEGVSLSVARRLLQVVVGPEGVPSISALGRATAAAGQRAGALLEVLDEAARPVVKRVAAAEIFWVADPS
jgi:hypothetical protein